MNRCAWARTELGIAYHDAEWGVPQHDDRVLFEFLILEGAQAGLSWETILKKRHHFREAFDQFDARAIAVYDHRKVRKLLANPGIIRNRLKIAAAIQNAKAFLAVQKEFGTFAAYLWQFVGGKPRVNARRALQEIPARTAESDALSKDLAKRGFKFVGSTICYAFMQAVGMVNDHTVDCFRYSQLRRESKAGQSTVRRPSRAGLKTLFVAAALVAHSLAGWCADRSDSPGDLRPALESITSHALLKHIKALSSDEFEGRAPASRGEDLTVGYLVDEFRKSRLQPGNPDGTYVQKVPLMGITSEPEVSFQVGEKRLDLALPGDCIATSHRFLPEVKVVDTDVVFVGYGIVAREYGWDDYKQVDVRGKTIIMLIGDPPISDPKNPAQLDEKMFKGRAMTYYGRWTYKYEIAAEKGAAAAIIVHETGPAGYPYFVLVASHGRENFELQSPDKNMGSVAVQGWLTFSKAKELFASAGQDFDLLKKAALGKGFKPVPAGAKASFTIKNKMREVNSQNVIAKLEGSDARRRNEYVIFTAHWDHLGRNEKLEGDQIFNGALDNASGTAGLLELAQAFAQLQTAPKRTILFLAPTAEEKGLLGAKHYVEHPLYALERTLANINMDGINPWGRTRDLEIVGYGNSTLEDMLRQAAAVRGRVTTPDSESPKGRFFRSDHFEFAKRGVPSLYIKGGVDFIGKPEGFGKQKSDEYTERDYHKVTDEIKPDWDLSGGVDDLRLLFEVGHRVAQEDNYPEWKPDSEFKSRRSVTPKANE